MDGIALVLLYLQDLSNTFYHIRFRIVVSQDSFLHVLQSFVVIIEHNTTFPFIQ
jgi:hypothetical protein